LLHFGELAYSILVLAGFIIPLFAHTRARAENAPSFLPLLFLDAQYGKLFAFLIVTSIAYPILLLCVFKIFAVFLGRHSPSFADPTRPLPIVLNVITSALAVATLMIQLIAFASGPSYFRTLTWIQYAVFVCSVAWNVFSLSFLIATLSRSNPVFQQYAAYRATEKGRAHGMQRRIWTMLLPLILAISVIPALLMMRDFCNTVLGSVKIMRRRSLPLPQFAVGGANWGRNLYVTNTNFASFKTRPGQGGSAQQEW
jgi:hypothetical protein